MLFIFVNPSIALSISRYWNHSKSQFLFKVRYVDAQRLSEVIIPDLITRADWVIVEGSCKPCLAGLVNLLKVCSNFDLEAYFQRNWLKTI